LIDTVDPRRDVCLGHKIVGDNLILRLQK
jgi:hypothetical protein